MTAKEYLSQARYLDNRIKSKLLQIDSLNELATRCTPSYSDMPKSPNHEGSRMESAILDIIELEDEISKDVVELVALKKEIVEVIKQVGNTEYQTLLEERYGINGGKISKLSLKMDGEWIANYDRGWDIEPTCEEAKLALSILLNKLN